MYAPSRAWQPIVPAAYFQSIRNMRTTQRMAEKRDTHLL